MEVIKFGDKLTIPGKNIQGEVAFIGETHFSDGTWFGIILDKPNGKHNGTVDGIRYFKCARNYGMFIRASYFEKQYVKINSATDKHRSLILKRIKYPNYLRANSKHKTEDNSSASKNISYRKVKRQSQDKDCEITCGDSVTNTNEEDAKLTAITECGDNIKSSDIKKIPFPRRYPNYLKASSKLAGSHLCCNKSNNDKPSQEIAVDDRVAHIDDKNLVLPIVDKNKDTPDKDDDSPKKRIIYPNYLKASSKLTEKHVYVGKNSDVNKTDNEITNSDGINDSPEKSAEMRTRKESADNNKNSENSVTKGIKCLNHRKTFSTENRPCLAKNSEVSQAKSLSENEDHEIPKENDSQDIHNKSVELEAVKRENEALKNKLKSNEVSLQEALSKYDKAQEEIKHLKYDNECQRKEIKFQKNHLKLLKMKQNNDFKKPDSFDKKSYQIKIDQLLESTLNERSNNDAKATSEKPHLESVKAMAFKHRILELEEQNRVMMQGLVELRDVLKTQCKSQSIGLGSLNSDSYCYFYNRRSKKITSSDSFGLPTILKPKAFTPEEPTAQLNENTEMLREMIKYNEIKKGKERLLKDGEAINFEKESSGETILSDKRHDSDNFICADVESMLNSSLEPEFNINIENHIVLSNDKMDCEAFQNFSVFEENDIQNYYETSISRNSQHFPNITTMVNGKTYKNQVGDRVPLKSNDIIDKLGNQTSTKELISKEDTSQSNAVLNEQDIWEKEVLDCAENLNSRESGTLPRVFMDVPSQPTGNPIRSSGDSPTVLPKPKQFKSKMFLPFPTELRQSQEMGSMNK